MDHAAAKKLTLRGVQPAHGSHIRNETLHDAQVVELINNVFSHQQAIFGKVMPAPYLGNKTSIEKALIPSRDWIAFSFYSNDYYCSPTLRLGLDGIKCPTDVLVDAVSQFSQTEDRNNLFFLVGEVGCGKTAFVNSLITRYGISLLSNRAHWFIRYNVHVHFDNTLTLNRLIVGISEKLQRLLDHFPRQLNLHTADVAALNTIRRDLKTISEGNPLNQNRGVFVRSIKSVSSALKRKPLIILDNLDAFFHVRDRYLFLKSKDTGEINEIKDILSIVNEFFHGQTELGDIGANILFVTRPDTYEILKSSKNIYQGTESCFSGDRNLFSIVPPDWAEVVYQRVNLLQHVIQAIASDVYRQKVRSALSDIIGALMASTRRGDGELISGLRDLTNFGLREIMEFLSHYTWIPSGRRDEGVDLTRRYIEQYPIGMLAYLLQNLKLFSEEKTKFPNIYLSNISSEEAEHISFLTGTGSSEWSSHAHSYWIRRLLLTFISARNERFEQVRLGDVLAVFSKKGQGWSYPENFVRVMLGSMTQNHAANLISVDRELSSDRSTLIATDISLTPRGRMSLKSIFDRFYYVQLVVDDFQLPIPRICKDAFSYQRGLDYGYLAAEGHEFGVQTKIMINRKARMSVDFAAILSVALAVERIRYAEVFARLQAEAIPPPSDDDLYASLMNQFAALNKSLQRGSEIDVEAFDRSYEKLKETIKPEIESAYGFF